jgi:site-specific recombinase XerC
MSVDPAFTLLERPGGPGEPPARHRRDELPCGNDLTKHRFTLAEARAILDDPVLDKRYQQTPLGRDVARYLNWKDVEWGASPETLRDYEPNLAWLCIDNPALGILDFTPPAGIELCRTCMARHWSKASPRTKKKIRSSWVDFFDWAIRECGLPGNPARAITIPKARAVDRKTFTEPFVRKVLESQDYPVDWILAFLILRYGLRRSGLQNTQLKHYDFGTGEVTVYTKGGEVAPLPIVENGFWVKLGMLELPDIGLMPDDFLVYRQDTRRRRVPLELADEVLLVKGEPVGYANVTTRAHNDQRPSGQTVHRWWYRCLIRAGLVPAGVTAGANMHRGRHTTGRAMQRHNHDLKLTQRLLMHKDISTTSIYSDLDTVDLAAALRAMERDD